MNHEDYREWRKIETWNADPKELARVKIFNGRVENYFARLWLKNIEHAKSCNLPVVSELYGSFAGTAIVCGAGPSLKRNKAALVEAHRRGCVFFATDRALGDLRDMGIHEFMSVSTECQPECGDFLKHAGKGDIVALNLISCPETRDSLIERGCSVYNAAEMVPYSGFWEMVYRDVWGEDISCVRPSLIVTFATVDIAHWMGFRTIITVGNDLCYDNADACAEDTEIRPDGGNGWMRRLKDGRWTFEIFEEAAITFNRFTFSHPDKKFLDASGGICDWPQMDLKKYLEEVA